MSQKALIIPPESAVEYFLENGYLEETDSYPMYRIAMNPDTFRIYSITELADALSKKFYVGRYRSRSTHKKPYLRELYKCLNEYQIQYENRVTKASEHWQFKMTERKWLEQKLGIDMEVIDEYDLHHKSGPSIGGKRWHSYWRGLKKRYELEDALRFFKDYFDRRMTDPSKKLRKGRKGKLLPIAQKQPYKELKEVDLNRPTSDGNNAPERLETTHLKLPQSFLENSTHPTARSTIMNIDVPIKFSSR